VGYSEAPRRGGIAFSSKLRLGRSLHFSARLSISLGNAVLNVL
jgi:hypothetical protein